MAITFIRRDQNDGVNIVRIVSTDNLTTISTSGYILAQDANITALNNGAWEWLLSDFVLVYSSAASGGGWGFYSISSDFNSLTPFAFSSDVIGTPVVVGDIAFFQSTSGNLEDLGISPSDPSLPKVSSVASVVVNQIPTFKDVNGSLQDSGYLIANNLLQQSTVSALTAHSGGGQASSLALTHAVNNVTTVAAAGDSVRLPVIAPGMQITITNSGANSMQVFGAGTDTINGITTTVGVPQLPGQTVVYTAATTANWLANVNSNPNPVQFVSVPMTAAQFNGMYAAPFLLIAAPGANKLISVESMELIMTFVSADYAAGGVVAGQYDNTVHGAGVLATNSEAAADFFAAASTVFQFVGTSGNTVGALPFSTTVNKGLYLSNLTQAFTTGDSTWVVKVYYRIINTTGAL